MSEHDDWFTNLVELSSRQWREVLRLIRLGADDTDNWGAAMELHNAIERQVDAESE